MSKNLVREMLVGRVGFGESSQACPASYSAEDAMAASIVRLECEAEELRAEVAMLREQASILAEERDEARAMQKWGMRRELEELLQVGDTECEEQFAKGVAALRNLIQERDDTRAMLEGKWHEQDPPLIQMMNERDKARAELEMWRDGNIMHEIHRDELEKVERERDEARAALERITESDMRWSKKIARDALEAAK